MCVCVCVCVYVCMCVCVHMRVRSDIKGWLGHASAAVMFPIITHTHIHYHKFESPLYPKSKNMGRPGYKAVLDIWRLSHQYPNRCDYFCIILCHTRVHYVLLVIINSTTWGPAGNL